MITVHHLNASRSTRVVWLLEELGIPYEIVRHERDKATMLAPPELEKIHPLGKSPVIVDHNATSLRDAARPGEAGDGTRVIAESGWILEYLVEKYGKGKQLVPAPDTQASDDCRYFMHYAEGSLMPQLLMKLVFTKVKTAPMPFFVKPIARRIADGVCQRVVDPNLKRHFRFLGEHLDKHAWIAGDAMTIADIQMSFPMIAAVGRGAELGVPASMIAYAKKLEAVPGYQRAVAKAGA